MPESNGHTAYKTVLSDVQKLLLKLSMVKGKKLLYWKSVANMEAENHDVI